MKPELELTVRASGYEAIEALEDLGYIVIPPTDPPPLTPQHVWELTEEAARQSSPYGPNALDEAWLRGRDATVEYMRDALDARSAPSAPDQRGSSS